MTRFKLQMGWIKLQMARLKLRMSQTKLRMAHFKLQMTWTKLRMTQTKLRMRRFKLHSRRIRPGLMQTWPYSEQGKHQRRWMKLEDIPSQEVSIHGGLHTSAAA
jgi:hypothetical protein